MRRASFQQGVRSERAGSDLCRAPHFTMNSQFKDYPASPGICRRGIFRHGPESQIKQQFLQTPLPGQSWQNLGVHLRVLVSLAGHRGSQVLSCFTYGFAGGGISQLLKIVELTEGMTCLPISSILENARCARIFLDIRLPAKVEIPPVCHRFTGEGVLQILQSTLTSNLSVFKFLDK